MKLVKVHKQLRAHYDCDKLARICTTWTRTEETCPDCGSAIMSGSRDGREYAFACSGCPSSFLVDSAPAACVGIKVEGAG